MMTKCLVFESDTESHRVWINFVDNFPELDLPEILKWLEAEYAAKFHLDKESWSLEFPDVDMCTQFVITWL